jgi:hypothetical protein
MNFDQHCHAFATASGSRPSVLPRPDSTAEDPQWLEDFRDLRRLRRLSPVRPVDWRWQLALLWLRRGGKLPRKPDKATRTTIRFLRRFHACEDELDYLKLEYCMPVTCAAYDIFDSGSDSLRTELQARLLSGDTIPVIAEKMSLPANVVRAYHAIFFHVQDRLNWKSWISRMAIGHRIPPGLQPSSCQMILRSYAYWGGPLVLDEVLDDYKQIPRPEKPSEVEQFFEADIRATLLRRIAIGLRTLPLDDPKTVFKLARLWMRLMQLDARRREMAQVFDNTAGNLEAFTAQMDRIWQHRDDPWQQWLGVSGMDKVLSSADRPVWMVTAQPAGPNPVR